jgi:hypothetical protein
MIDLDAIKNAGYKYTEIDTDIIMVHDFLTTDELDYLYSMASNASEEDWSRAYMNKTKKAFENQTEYSDLDTYIANDPNQWKDKILRLDSDQVIDGISGKVSNLITNNLELHRFNAIQRHYPGTKLDEHWDRDRKPGLKYASVIYINDDYEGGELYFPTRGIQVKPKAGSLVIFDSGPEYIHGVSVVEGTKTRYASVAFSWSKEE